MRYRVPPIVQKKIIIIIILWNFKGSLLNLLHFVGYEAALRTLKGSITQHTLKQSYKYFKLLILNCERLLDAPFSVSVLRKTNEKETRIYFSKRSFQHVLDFDSALLENDVTTPSVFTKKIFMHAKIHS